jgi:hypothetical protein
MYLCYIDESGDPGPAGSRHLILAAAVLFEGRWSWVRQDLNRLLQGYSPAGTTILRELHCADVRRRKGEFRILSKQQSEDLLRDACDLVTSMLSTEIRLFAVVIDKSWWFSRHPQAGKYDIYVQAFEELASRVDLFLRRRHAEGFSSKGLFIVDQSTTDLSSNLRRMLGKVQMSGTKWSQVYNLIETVLFLQSHESPGIQLADLCSFATWRLIEHGDDNLAIRLAPAFDREPPTSSVNAGKWHGMKYYGDNPVVRAAIKKVWP